MGSGDLKENMKKVGMYSFTFLFWYWVIAFFLKSEYPIYNYSFNRRDAYEVVRDGLTLLAYFLAPVVAFLLFNDWRSQHSEIKNEEVTQDIWKLVDKISVLLNFSAYSPNSEEFHENSSKVYELIGNLDIQKDLLRLNNSGIEEYHKNLEELISLLRIFGESYRRAISANNIVSSKRLEGQTYKHSLKFKQELEDAIIYNREMTDIKSEINNIRSNLKPRYVK